MHWSLDQLRDLDIHDFDELCEWLKDRSERSKSDDEGSVDMDKLIDANKAKKDRDGSE